MWDIEPFFFDNLHIAKQMADYEHQEHFLKACGTFPVDSEDYFELSWEAIQSVFPDVSNHYNEESAEEALIIFDPLIDELCRLASEDELERIMASELWGDFQMEGYTYDYDIRLYDGSHGRARLVILMGPEFCGFQQLPGCLAEAHDDIERNVNRLRMEKELKLLQPAETGQPRKEAA